jgi:ABC-type branched-subunit amino acid transport system ATPase component/ABC-type branched-subunit amino acid transport system permease subunit
VKPVVKYALAILLLAGLPFVAPNTFYVHVGQTFAYTAIAVIGLNILLGLSGQMSLGHGGFVALGAYGSAILSTTFGWPIVATLPIGLVVVAIAGVFVGLAALRTRGLHLAVATLAFGFIVEILVQRWTSLTGGTMGLMGVPQIDFGNFKMGPAYFFWTAAAALLLVQIGSDYLFESATGRQLRAIKESEPFAKTIGLYVPGWRTATFTASAILAGLSGALFAHQDGFLSSDAFNIRLTITLLIATVIGGVGRTYGPLLGTAVMLGLTEALASIHDVGQLVYGAILIVVLTLFPEGGVGLIDRLTSGWRRASKDGQETGGATVDLAPLHPVGLVVQGLSKRYAGVVALKGAGLEVRPGNIHALIGPNGAGKSTFINIVAGLYAPNEGSITIGGKDVTGLAAHRRARLGLVRTFQNLQLIWGVDVLSNVMLGMQRRRHLLGDFLDWLRGSGHESAEKQTARSILGMLGIARFADQKPTDLSYGHRKLVELARAIAQRPSILLLDEPVAGLNAVEARGVARTIELLRDAGVAVLIVEHNMEFVMSLADSITVLDFGHPIAAGAPAAVRANPAVQQAYLGVESAA